MLQFTNNATSVLASSITAAALSLSLSPGTGARFPNPTGGNGFLLTLFQMSGSTEVNHEIVLVTARASDTCTIVRAQEGTTARAFNNADPVSHRVTAGSLAPAALGMVDAAGRDKAGGFPGLTALKLNLRNAADTITSWLTNANTAARTYTLPDKDITFAGLSDLPPDLTAAVTAKLDKSGGTMAGDIVGGDNKIVGTMLKDVGYVAVDKGNSGTATQTFDYTAGSKQKVTATGAHTFAFSNWPPIGNEGIMRVDFINYGAFTITPPSITWTNPDGTETTSLPTHFAALANLGGRSGFTTSGVTKAIFWSADAGTTVYGKFI